MSDWFFSVSILFSKQRFEKRIETEKNHILYPYKGGVPAAPSSTATLLRLHPSH